MGDCAWPRVSYTCPRPQEDGRLLIRSDSDSSTSCFCQTLKGDQVRSKRWWLAVGLAAGASLAFFSHRAGGLVGLLTKIRTGIEIVVGRLQEQGVRTVYLWLRDHALRILQGMSPADTCQIAPGLFVGGQQYRRGLGRMATLGIGATLSLREEADDKARGAALERHLWLPTVDDTPPTLEQLRQAVDFVRLALNDGCGVYIHCASGVGRAPTAAAAYLVSTGLAPAEAWSLIRSRRPFIRPKPVQFQQIERFHGALRNADV